MFLWPFKGNCQASDTTSLQWAADGQHFLTATTAPRLRTANGYKIWHYSGSLLYENNWPKDEELYEVVWKVIFSRPRFYPVLFKFNVSIALSKVSIQGAWNLWQESWRNRT